MTVAVSIPNDLEPLFRHRRTFSKRLLRWFRTSGRSFPWRDTDDPYRVLMAEIMLQRTGSSQVLAVYNDFIRRYPSPNAVVSASEDQLAEDLHPLGRLTRAGLVRAAMERIVVDFGGDVPRTYDGLIGLPGIGPYTARAVLCFAFGEPVGVLDPNVLRIIGRVFRLYSRRPRARTDPALWHAVDVLVSKKRPREFNWALLDLAVLVCRNRNPRPNICPLKDLCCCRGGAEAVEKEIH